MKADRPLEEVYADIKEILQAWTKNLQDIKHDNKHDIKQDINQDIKEILQAWKKISPHQQIFCNRVLSKQPSWNNKAESTNAPPGF